MILVNRMSASESRSPRLVSAGMLVAGIAALKFLLHLYAGRYYGYFVDELYNLALARHLAWGYVDVAPMIGLLGRIELILFGDSVSLSVPASAIFISSQNHAMMNCQHIMKTWLQ